MVEFLQKQGFVHHSAREMLTEIIKSRGLPEDRDSMMKVANELRAKEGPSALVANMLYNASKQGKDCVIESVRTSAEAALLKENGAVLVSVNAPVATRYERICARGSVTDQVSFEKFQEDEQREMSNMDLNKQNLTAVMAMADISITNDGDVDALYSTLTQKLPPSVDCVAASKPAGPKRPRSGYIFYTQSVREDAAKSNPTLKMADLSRLMGSNWNGLDAEAKKPFGLLAADDKLRYETEKKAWEAEHGQITRGKRPKKANATGATSVVAPDASPAGTTEPPSGKTKV